MTFPPERNFSLGWSGVFFCLLLCGLSMGLGLGTSSRLSYHEAFVAQGAREMIDAGQWWHPTIGGRPWLEKPPLPFWLAAGLGWCSGELGPTLARLPSLIAASLLVLGVGLIAAQSHGTAVGLLAVAVQATTSWTVLRGRLAEADMLLACLVTWTLLAFSRLRETEDSTEPAGNTFRWRWLFFVLLGLTSLVKGTGFGAALVVAVVLGVLVWDRDWATARRFRFPAGWLVAGVLTVGWPLAMVLIHGVRVLDLWFLHVTERVGPQVGHGPFAAEGWTQYVVNVAGQGLPWAPLAVAGCWPSLRRALGNASRGDRLLWAWAVLPLLMVSIPGGRKAQYAIYAMIPWSVWTALTLERLGCRLQLRGWRPQPLRRVFLGTFAGLATIYGMGFWLAGPWLDRRGVEWAFYERVGRDLPPGEPVVLLYDDWDRDAYPTPFGPIPHDLGVRLYYLNRPACWHFEATSLRDHGTSACQGPAGLTTSRPFAIVGRQRDLPALEQAGRVEVVAQGPPVRWDRTYLLARVWPTGEASPTVASAGENQ